MLRLFLGIILFWAIYRFFRALAKAFLGPPRRPPESRVNRGRGRPDSLKADDAIDVDYTESTSQESSKERQ